MIYFIAIILLVIIGTLIFIAINTKFILSLKQNHFDHFDRTPRIIERAYQAVDFRYSFQYLTDFPAHFHHNPIQIVENEDHKKYIFNKAFQQIARDMGESGCIEIRESNVNFNPTHKIVDMKVKVYKPDPQWK